MPSPRASQGPEPLSRGGEPAPMSRIAIVAADSDMHRVLAEVADVGVTELECSPEARGEAAEAVHRLEQAGRRPAAAPPVVPGDRPDIASLEEEGRWDLLAGEAELETRLAATVPHGGSRVAVGWMPSAAMPHLQDRVARLGAALVELPKSPLRQPPTLLRPPAIAGPFQPLVTTYGVVRYTDIDPTTFAGLSFVLMFGMMFGDAGHGLMVVIGGLLLRARRPAMLARYRDAWPVVVACGLAATVFGVLYGEFFGPTHVIPALWMAPLQDPLRLLVAGIVVGLVLLGVSYVIGSVNRWRQGGPAIALYAASGLAGLLLFCGLGVAVAGATLGVRLLVVGGVVAALLGLALLFAGFLREAGLSGTGLVEAFVETADALVRLISNTTSFARLAAFGVVHAAIGDMVWRGTTGLAHGIEGFAAAAILFAAGNAVAFVLEGLVTAIQALRLEYYELFSRIFGSEGRPFKPWHVSLATQEEMT